MIINKTNNKNISANANANGAEDIPEWLNHYFFVLHTIASHYPKLANAVTKKKYYNFIHDLPILFPEPKLGDLIAKYLDKYPLTPYLDKREDFMKWHHFIHNKICEHYGYETLNYIDYIDKYQKKHHIIPLDLSRIRGSPETEAERREYEARKIRYIKFGVCGLFLVFFISLYTIQHGRR
jgi:hypothetical protein